ncbi:MAG: Lipopolysaccharide core biosynthesis protein RfaG [Candidatus Anoxychlamydiales bacterium]|nr:Lipopolysaccharide core biosynthesis protein RfaG [Candidatus Anoxychlamydiales bacterium]NGX36075.1 Lipopolysaccharide core biosynthesis protein RfaG [Candidatus Anoxychlamydiales bacterium]
MKEIIFIKYHLNKAGGLEKYSYRIVNAFLAKGYKVTLLTSRTSKEFLEKKDINLIILKPFKIFKFIKLKIFDLKCIFWIKKNKPKLIFSFDRTSVYTHTRLGNGLHLAFLKRRKIFENKFKLFLNKINPLHRVILTIEKKGFKQKGLKKVIVNSNMVKTELIELYNFDPKNISVILNGVEHTELFDAFSNWEVEKTVFAKKLNLDPAICQLLFIGNDYKRKGLNFLLKALAKISEKVFHLSVVGKEKNITKYMKLVKRLNLESKVSFYNKRDDIINFYQLSDIAILPTLYDPFSNVTVEALAMGLFTITSIYNGAKEIITKDNGSIIDPLDISGFAKVLSKAMENKKDNKRANIIRQSVKKLDFSNQLNTLIKTVEPKL